MPSSLLCRSHTNDNEAPVFLDEYNKVYERFKPLPIIIEGPEYDNDYSYFLVDKCQDLKDLEKGIALAKFDQESQSSERDPEMEFRLLSRMNCHKLHYQNLYKSQNIDFKRKNRYNEVLPFTHSMVKIRDQNSKSEEHQDRYWNYINACYINVRAYLL